MKLDDIPDTQPMALNASEELLPAALADSTVMMVDDEPLMTDLIQLHLSDHGYRSFIVVNNPLEAMATLRERQPELLLLDLNMPVMSGFELLAAVRSDRRVYFTPVIVLTATTMPDAKLRALGLGATDFLAKPVDASELVLRVRNTLAARAFINRTMNYDATTRLPNWRMLERRMTRLLARPGGQPWALLNVTIAECRQIRNTLGVGATDLLLRTVAERLSATVRHGETAERRAATSGDEANVMRLDSDTFAVLLPTLNGDADATEAARRVLGSMQAPVTLQGHEVALTTHIGIAMAPADGTDIDAIVKAADHARTQAQARGAPGYDFFSADLNASHHAHLKLGAQLRRAAERGELRLHYQPKVDLATGAVAGAEALLRWQHPEHGLIAPGRFIPLAEELGLIVSIGEWVIRRACAEAASWIGAGRDALCVAVNVSQLQFDSGALVETLRSALADAGLAPHRLVVELTESMLMADAQAALDQMHAIKALGVSLSIDDFGTGYSSLGYLKRLPVDELKVDRSFVIDLPGGRQDVAIVATVISLGHSLGMRVVAEGVETLGQRDALRGLGCDVYQGFLFSRAVTPEAFLALLPMATSGPAIRSRNP